MTAAQFQNCHAASPAEVPWGSVSNELRLAQLGKMCVARDVETMVQRTLDRVRFERLTNKEPANVIIIGETGVGKSDIMARYLQRNPPARLPTGNLRRPVFLIELRNSSTPLALAQMMLAQLGLERDEYLRGSLPVLSGRLKHQLVAQQVELVIIDEFNNVLPQNGHHRVSKVAEWVKDLSKTKTRTAENPHGLAGENIPFVLVGTKKVERVLDPASNSELASLTPNLLTIPRYAYRTAEEKREFRSFLDSLDFELPFDEDSQLGSVDPAGNAHLADKIHLATYGLLRQVGYLVRRAAIIAIEVGDARIREHHLWESVESQRGLLQSSFLSDEGTQSERRVVVNPFTKPLLATRPTSRKRGYKELS